MKPRIFALYLPQYHPFPENDEWWGKGFTEWTNVARARKLFPGHKQPHIPTDLGFYDLRLSEVREEQARLAKDAGIEVITGTAEVFGKNISKGFLYTVGGIIAAFILGIIGAFTGKKIKKSKAEKAKAENREKAAERRKKRQEEENEDTDKEEDSLEDDED